MPGHRLRCELTGLAPAAAAASVSASTAASASARLEHLMAVDRRVKSRHALCFASLFCHDCQTGCQTDRQAARLSDGCQAARFLWPTSCCAHLQPSYVLISLLTSEQGGREVGRSVYGKGLLQLRLELKCAYKFVIAFCAVCSLQSAALPAPV